MSSLLEGFADVGYSFGRLFRSRAFYGFLLVTLCFAVPALFFFSYAMKYDVVLQFGRPMGFSCREVPQLQMLTAMLMTVFCCMMFVLAVGEYVSALRWKNLSHRTYRAHMRMTVCYCLSVPVLFLGPIWIMMRYC